MRYSSAEETIRHRMEHRPITRDKLSRLTILIYPSAGFRADEFPALAALLSQMTRISYSLFNILQQFPVCSANTFSYLSEQTGIYPKAVRTIGNKGHRAKAGGRFNNCLWFNRCSHIYEICFILLIKYFFNLLY